MMTKLTGQLVRVLDEELRVAVGPFEYQVLVPESVRRHVQLKTGQEVTLHISEYYEGNQAGTRLVPRKIGFQTEAELEFFELFCTVDKIGVKKALKALSRPVREIADAISRQDTKWLATLPGIGAATAEQIVSTLKRKVAKFAVSNPTPGDPADPGAATVGVASSGAATSGANPSSQVVEDVYQALMAVGLSPIEARSKLDLVLQSGQAITSVEDALNLIFAK